MSHTADTLPSKRRSAGGGAEPEEQYLLNDLSKNGSPVTITPSKTNSSSRRDFEKPLLPPSEPVRLTPAWEDNNLTNDELNFKGVTMETADLETNPPHDRWKLVYMTLMLHGVGTLMPWNMFITAKDYFVEYKLGYEYTGVHSEYKTNFLPYIGLAAQAPNIAFNWLNIFINIGGNLTTRIVWSIFMEVIAFVFTVALVMIDTSSWPGIFFAVTMATVVFLNMANGIYQNTVYGMAAKLPGTYTGAVVLGSNISGAFTAIINIVSIYFTPDSRTAAIYYFITALFILLACFDTYFALPLNRFYRYHELVHQKALASKKQATSAGNGAPTPYWKIFRQTFPQLFNVFFIFFITLAIFPAVHSDIKVSDPDFPISSKYYVAVLCFLTFNVSAMVGSSLTSLVQWPGTGSLVIPVVLRALFIPAFLLSNYQPMGVTRVLPVLISNDWAYWTMAIAMGLSSGYLSSLAMMYCPRMVEPQHAATAGMFGAACLTTGVGAGIAVSSFMPWIVANVRLPQGLYS
uniref:Equilibrative nucleoside transporter 1 n=1 Tax=Cacopsylla melanoneura TaxID=428564 RepID=A0A8D8VE71_9HEMI